MGDSVTFPSSEGFTPGPELLGGRYRVKRELGRGGMGTVLLAHHEELDQDVAIKVLSPEVATNHEFIVRLRREAKAIAKLKSEHAVRVTDVDTLDEAGPYMVMDYLEGRNLRQEVDARGPLPVGEVVGYVLEALDALVEAHALGIVHRDLKPSNLFLAQQPSGTRCVKVLDFGISKVGIVSDLSDDLTSSRALLGTPLYMSPEQLRSPKDVDARADVWSLGVVMYELLAGQTPFNGSTVGELCFAIAETTPKPLRAFRGDVPSALDRIVQRCLRRDPADRFTSAAELFEALSPLARGDASDAAKRRTTRLILVGASVVGLAGVIWQVGRPAVTSTSSVSSAPLATTAEPSVEHATLPEGPVPSANEPPAPSMGPESTTPALTTTAVAAKGPHTVSSTSKPAQKRSTGKPPTKAKQPELDPNLDVRH
jgi:serine/threonine-protein kinase